MTPQLCKPRHIVETVYKDEVGTDEYKIWLKIQAISYQRREGLIPRWAWRRVGRLYEYRLDYFLGGAREKEAQDRPNKKLLPYLKAVQ